MILIKNAKLHYKGQSIVSYIDLTTVRVASDSCVSLTLAFINFLPVCLF